MHRPLALESVVNYVLFCPSLGSNMNLRFCDSSKRPRYLRGFRHHDAKFIAIYVVRGTFLVSGGHFSRYLRGFRHHEAKFIAIYVVRATFLVSGGHFCR